MIYPSAVCGVIKYAALLNIYRHEYVVCMQFSVYFVTVAIKYTGSRDIS